MSKTDKKLLASAVEYAVDGKLSGLEWQRFMVEHYPDPEMESARAECVRILIQYPDKTRISQDDRSRLYAVAAQLRDAT